MTRFAHLTDEVTCATRGCDAEVTHLLHWPGHKDPAMRHTGLCGPCGSALAQAPPRAAMFVRAGTSRTCCAPPPKKPKAA